MELQSRHVREQMETFVRQLEEMRDLTAQIIQEANPGSSPYAPSSSYPPGETGRAQVQNVQPGSWLMAWNALWMARPQPSRMA
jgi:hypothetical protein